MRKCKVRQCRTLLAIFDVAIDTFYSLDLVIFDVASVFFDARSRDPVYSRAGIYGLPQLRGLARLLREYHVVMRRSDRGCRRNS